MGTAACICLSLWLVGCSGTPFRDEVRVRTPYERYQTLRGQARPTTYTDSFGREKPNLRVRLAPLDEG